MSNLGGRVSGGRGKRGEDREEKVEPTKAGGARRRAAGLKR